MLAGEDGLGCPARMLGPDRTDLRVCQFRVGVLGTASMVARKAMHLLRVVHVVLIGAERKVQRTVVNPVAIQVADKGTGGNFSVVVGVNDAMGGDYRAVDKNAEVAAAHSSFCPSQNGWVGGPSA